MKKATIRIVLVSFATIAAFAIPYSPASAETVIIANPGPFGGIEQAAVAEERVDWWDGDFSDDRACTECFAATELARFLPLCTLISKQDIRFLAPERLP